MPWTLLGVKKDMHNCSCGRTYRACLVMVSETERVDVMWTVAGVDTRGLLADVMVGKY